MNAVYSEYFHSGIVLNQNNSSIVCPLLHNCELSPVKTGTLGTNSNVHLRNLSILGIMGAVGFNSITEMGKSPHGPIHQ